MTVAVERADGLVTITLSRPEKKNALDSGTWREIEAAVDDIRGSAADRCVVLTGEGPDFCSGADLAERWLPDPPLRGVEMVQQVIAKLHELPQPTIAKVRGAVIGAGMCLALACDFMVAAESAKFSMKFNRVGLTLDSGGSWFLAQAVGVRKAKELALFGTTVTGAEGTELGFVNRCVPDAELDGAVEEWVKVILDSAPTAAYLTKRLIGDSAALTLRQALDAEARAQSIAVKSPDFKEAMTAMRERRSPVYGAG